MNLVVIFKLKLRKRESLIIKKKSDLLKNRKQKS